MYEFHFLWIIGLGLFAGWWITDAWFIPREFRPARSWYSVPVIGITMAVSWVLIQITQTLS